MCAATFTTLHSFEKKEGSYPSGSLLYADGALWGTTATHGTGPSPEDGTAFSLPLDGSPIQVSPFHGSPDNRFLQEPESGLIKYGNEFFGTAITGGPFGGGAVFKLNRSGQKRITYSFNTNTSDGIYPSAPLILVHGAFYSTTTLGGAQFRGAVFKVTRQGQETILHAFGDTATDGTMPNGPLLYVKGALYGETCEGGTSAQGTVFKIPLKGAYKIIYSFPSNNMGGCPMGGLIYQNGLLYGVTYIDGGNDQTQAGTVFSLTLSGRMTVVHAFQSASKKDGRNPIGGLIALGGLFYGTTTDGGTAKHGTIYSVTPAGVEAVIYNFQDGPDGGKPISALITDGTRLYGNTQSRGADDYGTIFSLAP